MKNFTIYAVILMSLLVSKASAQETFEGKAHAIAVKIENITKEEKAALKIEIEAINKELEAGTLAKEQADAKKMILAEARSKNIENRIAEVQEELKDLVQQKVDGKIFAPEMQSRNSIEFIGVKLKEKDSIFYNGIKYKVTYKTSDSLYIDINGIRKAVKSRGRVGDRRTTSQFVFAAGVNNLVTNGAIANSDYRYWGSHFYEWGVTWNTRLLKNNNLLHLKYGMSLMYNNLRPTDNRYFVVNGDQTNLEVSSIHLDDSRFRNVYIAVPLHLEFDFTKVKDKDGKKIFKTHESVRFGIGGYAGVRVKSKQILEFNEGSRDVTQKTKGNFNANDFIYGVSTYIGYKSTSLYLKYDLNPLFKDNAIKQNNISLGIRFDLN